MSKKNCKVCKYEHQINTLQEESKKNNEQHEKFQSKFEEGRVFDEVIVEKYQTILNVLTELKEQVRTLTETPNKRWETIITCLITGVASFLVAYFLR